MAGNTTKAEGCEPRLPHRLKDRPRHPHPERSQSGVREAAVELPGQGMAGEILFIFLWVDEEAKRVPAVGGLPAGQLSRDLRVAGIFVSHFLS